MEILSPQGQIYYNTSRNLGGPIKIYYVFDHGKILVMNEAHLTNTKRTINNLNEHY